MRQKFGQHFLTDRRIIKRIVSTANITPNDRVVEIGPGKGNLTFPLARQAKQLIAIEYDPELSSRLQQAFEGQHNVRILQADARNIDYNALFSDWETQIPRVKIIANLPYYAAVPILLALFRSASLFTECTLMFQKEVAERITASPGNKSYGTLSVTTQYYSNPVFCFSISPQAFQPRPNVESAVVKLQFFEHPRIEVLDQEFFFHLVKCAFRSRRKTLKNSLITHCAGRFPGHLLHSAYEQLHLPEKVRGEELSLEDFAHLSNCLIRILKRQNK